MLAVGVNSGGLIIILGWKPQAKPNCLACMTSSKDLITETDSKRTPTYTTHVVKTVW